MGQVNQGKPSDSQETCPSRFRAPRTASVPHRCIDYESNQQGAGASRDLEERGRHGRSRPEID